MRGRGPTFVVTTHLGVEHFDRRRDASAQLRSVMAEVRRIRRADHRVVATTLRRERRRRSGYRLAMTVSAPSAAEAFDIAAGVVRAAIHAAGGSTAQWVVQPRLDHRSGCWEVPRRPVSWAEADARAERQLAALPRLEPIGGVTGSTAVIDLR